MKFLVADLTKHMNQIIKIMISKLKQLKFCFFTIILCLSFVFLNSCQSAEDEFVFKSDLTFTKDSKIVSLLLSSVENNSKNTFSKNITDDDQCTQFVYPMTFYAYYNDDTEPTAVQINSDEELTDFLTALTSGQEFFIMYPVTLVDIDGVETTIYDYPDLEGILTMLVDACGRDTDDNDDSDDDDNNDDGDDNDGDDNDIDYEYCGNNNKKVVICHNGNSICISINAIWGHMAHHEDDYFGSCSN